MEEYFFLSIPPQREDQETVFVIRFTSLRRISAVFLSIRSQALISPFTAILFQFVVQSTFPFSNIQCLNIIFILLRNLRLNFIIIHLFLYLSRGIFYPPQTAANRMYKRYKQLAPHTACVVRIANHAIERGRTLNFLVTM